VGADEEIGQRGSLGAAALAVGKKSLSGEEKRGLRDFLIF
jgi:hypothetical protein